jgi:hypothetical protein
VVFVCSIAQGDDVCEINKAEIMAACLKNAVNSLLPKYSGPSSRTQSIPRGGSTFNLFDFRVKWHELHNAVQCRAHGSTFEFLFEFQTEFFV